MIWNTLRRALGLDPNDRALRKYEGVVEQINELSEKLESRSEDELRAILYQPHNRQHRFHSGRAAMRIV